VERFLEEMPQRADVTIEGRMVRLRAWRSDFIMSPVPSLVGLNSETAKLAAARRVAFKSGVGKQDRFLSLLLHRRRGHIYRPKERSRDHGARFSEVSQGGR
jgi:hypothetical protein